MDFLNPLMLAGAATAVVPIVLHLIMRQRPRHVLFPALQFIQARREANRRRLKLRHLLLLLLRAAVLLLLAFALARPSVRATRGIVSQEEPAAAAFVFDTSPRMLYRTANQTRLDVAREQAGWLLAQLPPRSQVAVLESSLRSVVFQVDLPAARQRISRLDVSTMGRGVPVLLDEAVRLLGESDKRRKELYVFTDLSRAAWSAEASTELQKKLASFTDLGVYLIDSGVSDPQNFALTDLRLSGQVVPRNSPVRISTEVARTGPAGTLGVEVFVEDSEGKRQLRDSREAVEIAAEGSQPVEFSLGALPVGTHQGLVRLVGADGLSIDDERYFTVDVQPAWKVLVVAPPPAEDTAGPLTEALAPLRHRLNGQARFELKVIPADQLEIETLTPFAAVFLVDPGALSPGAWKRLGEHVASGSGLGIFLGRRTSRETQSPPEAADLLPGPLGEQARFLGGELAFAPENLDHPVLAVFRQRQSEIDWNAFPVFRYWQLESLATGARVVAKFSNGDPALLERSVGSGRVLTLMTSVTDPASRDPWSLLLTGIEPWPGFVLVNQMALYLVPAGDAVLNYAPGQLATLALPADVELGSYILKTPNGEVVRGTAERFRRRIEITATQWPGNYRLQSGGAGGIDRGLSVNYPAVESELARLDPSELKRVFGDVTYQVARDRKALQRNLERGRVGRELYPFLMILVAMAFSLEHLVANRFYTGRG